MALVQVVIAVCLAVASCLLGACDRPMERTEQIMATYNVSNASELATALASAQGGDRILLAAGNYGDLSLKNRAFGSEVEIVSADPNNPAEFRTVTLNTVSNLTFRSVEIGYTLAPGEPTFAKMVNVTKGSYLTFDDVHVRGSMDGNPVNDGNGISVLDSDHVRVVNSEFQQLNRAAMFGNSTHIEVRNNNFHDLRSDGVDFAEVQNVLIDNNRFTNFFPEGTAHPDAIQFWTRGTTKPSTDIVISNNVILQGEGRGTQGIFLSDKDGLLPFERVTITNNLVYVNDGHNGLHVFSGKSVVVQNNTVVSERGDKETIYIRMEQIDGLVLKHNVSDTIINDRNSNVYLVDNIRFDQSPSRADELRDLQVGAGATPEGLTIDGVGYHPGGAPTPVKTPRIGDAGSNFFYAGSDLNGEDFIDGAGSDDAVGIQGNYTAMTLGRYNLQNIEALSIFSGSDGRFGDTANNRYSYDLASIDANVSAGSRLTINAGMLLQGENFTFNGSAEIDGSFFIYAGWGRDVLTGGAGVDQFYFGDGRFNAGDRADGGAGMDAVTLRGDYAGANALVFAADTWSNIEGITVTSASDTRFMSGGTRYSYDLTVHDGNLAAGRSMTYHAARLLADETLTFNGSAETDGHFTVYGGAGADVITGGAGNDLIYGGLGQDRLTGGAGSDTFLFRSAAESTGPLCDQLIGFDCRTDKLDLPGDLPGLSDIVTGGSLSLATFDTDLSAALNAFLGKGEAALFTASAGDMAGRAFLVVDANGQAGYQAGEDFVLELVDPVVPINPSLDFFV